MSDLHCSCGNKFLVSLVTMSDDSDIIAQPPEHPTCWCPGCSSIWQFVNQSWRKVVSSSSLQSLRMLSAK